MKKKPILIILIGLLIITLLVGCQSKEEKKKQINHQLTEFTNGINSNKPGQLQSALAEKVLIYADHLLIIRSKQNLSKNINPLLECSGFNNLGNMDNLKLTTNFSNKSFSFARNKVTLDTTLHFEAVVYAQTLSWTSQLKLFFTQQEETWQITKIKFL